MNGGESSEIIGKATKGEQRYSRIIERIFQTFYQEGTSEVVFTRADINRLADELDVERVSNVGDLLYYFKFRQPLPESIRAKAPAGRQWVLRGAGRSRYGFFVIDPTQVPVNIEPNPLLAETKVPDATPGVIAMHALNDEQALLARVRYNRLIDIFTGVTCYSLQSHLRTQVNREQNETDEVYIGVDRRGAHYVFPVQAKGHRDKLGLAQIEDDVRVCALKFPHLICRPVAAQFMRSEVIALFAFEPSADGVTIIAERHYRLVPPEEMMADDLQLYRERPLAE